MMNVVIWRKNIKTCSFFNISGHQQMSMQPKNGEITTQNSNGKLPDVCENHKKSCFKKTRIKQTFLRLEEEKYSPFFVWLFERRQIHIITIIITTILPIPHFFIFFFVPILRSKTKKEKQICNWKYEVIFYVCCFSNTHTRNKRNCPPSKQKIKIHHDNKKYSQ